LRVYKNLSSKEGRKGKKGKGGLSQLLAILGSFGGIPYVARGLDKDMENKENLREILTPNPAIVMEATTTSNRSRYTLRSR
jgi:hypothetical protein